MKKFILVLLIAACFLQAEKINAQVNKQDSLALVDLYDSCHTTDFGYGYGSWTGPVSTWRGVGLTGSRVTSVAVDVFETEDDDYIPLEGKLPESIGNLTELKFLSFYGDHLNGNIPSTICNLKKLVSLNFEFDQFSGSLPDSLGNLKDLNFLDLHYNKLTGVLPSSLGKLTNLTYFSIETNQISGNIPFAIGNLINLQT